MDRAIAALKRASPMTQVCIGGVLEAFGGALMLLGLFTRPAAFLLAGEMAVTYFQFHAPNSLWPVLIGGVSAALYCFIRLYFSATGPGPWSLDAMRKKYGTAPVARRHREPSSSGDRTLPDAPPDALA